MAFRRVAKPCCVVLLWACAATSPAAPQDLTNAQIVQPLVHAAFPEQAQGPEGDEREARGRVQALSSRLKYRENDPVDRQRYDAEMRAVTDRLRQEVDRYVREAVSPWEDSSRIQSRLRTLLAGHEPHPEVGNQALAWTADLREGRALLAAYILVRPPHHDSATIRGYRADAQRLELVGTTGQDFEGYGMFIREVPSPVPGELWLLAWGRSHTFNGTLVRFRLYAFDALRFRTVWSPEDLLNARVSFADAGFAIDYYVPGPPFDRRDEYLLTPEGPIETASR